MDDAIPELKGAANDDNDIEKEKKQILTQEEKAAMKNIVADRAKIEQG